MGIANTLAQLAGSAVRLPLVVVVEGDRLLAFDGIGEVGLIAAAVVLVERLPSGLGNHRLRLSPEPKGVHQLLSERLEGH